MNKRIKSLLSVYICICLVFAGLYVDNAVNAETKTNIAKSCGGYVSTLTRTAGDETTPQSVTGLTDESLTSNCNITTTDADPWCFVNLGDIHTIDEVVIYQGSSSYANAYATKYTVEYTADNVTNVNWETATWTTIATVTNGTCYKNATTINVNGDRINFAAVQARCVRVRVDASTIVGSRVAFTELMVYEAQEETTTNAATETLYGSYATDLANGKNGYASSNQRNGTTVPLKVGNLTNNNTTGTNYIITHADDAQPWFCVDLGTAYDVNKVNAYQGSEATYPNAYATQYVIEYSDYKSDLVGANDTVKAAYIATMEWKVAATVTGAQLGANIKIFESVNTRYVRVRALTKYATNVSLYEMYVYQTDFSNPLAPETTKAPESEVGSESTSASEIPSTSEKLYGSFSTDLAVGKNGYASSNDRQNVTTPVKVGNLTNGNITAGNFIVAHSNDVNPWFCVDLGSAYDINKVNTYQGGESPYQNSYASEFVIEYSDYTGDLAGASDTAKAAYIATMEWKVAATVTGAQLSANTKVFESVNTRYVRVRAVTKAATTVSLYEIYVYQTDFSKEYVPETTDPNAKPLKILFIGNSLTEYNDVAGKVQLIFQKQGISVTWTKLIQLGKSLEYHYSLPETGTAILNGKYDYIVLQDKASGFSGTELMTGADHLYNDFISKTSSKMIMYMPWANKDVLLSSQKNMTDAYVAVAKKYKVPFAAAGEAWFDLYFNSGYDWYSDNIHATNTGSMVSACAIYYAISGNTTPLAFTSSDTIISTNGYNLAVANLVSQKTCYYTSLANADINNYKSIADGFTVPETTIRPEIPEEPTVEPGELTTGKTVDTSVFTDASNIAKGKSAYASSTKQAASYATDGNLGTRWETESTEPHWIYVDLGALYNISKVGFYWEGAYAKKYHIQVSNVGGTNDADWTTVKTVTATGRTTVQIDIDEGVSARYVRMYGETRGTIYGFSLYEFGVWGSVASYQAEKDIIDIAGFQLKTSYDNKGKASPGYRVIMRLGDDKIDASEITATGIIIMNGTGYNKALMTTDKGDIDGTDLSANKLNENGALIAVSSRVPLGWSSTDYANESTSSYYAFLMVNNISQTNLVASLKADYYVRAFAQLANGTIVYSPIYKSSIYDAADSLYQGKKMSNETAHDYLYTNILKVVNSSYSTVDYAWSSSLHRPTAE